MGSDSDRQKDERRNPGMIGGIKRCTVSEWSLVVVAWNCNRVAASIRPWDCFLDLEPDVGVLQEVGDPPAAVRERHGCELQTAPDRE